MIATPAREALEAEGLFQFKKDPKPETCCVKNCRNHAGQPKKKVGPFYFCSACWMARWRWKHPKHAAYRALLDHARQRGLECTLTFDYFCGMMDSAGAWDQDAERRGEIVSIDRIDATKGYCRGNVRIISLSANVIKGNRERHLPDHVQSVIARKRARYAEKIGALDGPFEPDEEDCPF